jgi:hypothetical protein
VSDVLNIDVPDLPDKFTPLELVAVVKCLDDQGNPTIAVRTSEGLMAWEVIGMLTAASDMARADLVSDLTVMPSPFEDPDEEEDDQ